MIACHLAADITAQQIYTLIYNVTTSWILSLNVLRQTTSSLKYFKFFSIIFYVNYTSINFFFNKINPVHGKKFNILPFDTPSLLQSSLVHFALLEELERDFWWLSHCLQPQHFQRLHLPHHCPKKSSVGTPNSCL